jgi:LysM repeat protein
MQTVRQMAGGLVYAVVSLLLVVGSLALSLAQGAAPPSATASVPGIATGTNTQLQSPQPTKSLLLASPSATGTGASTLTPGATAASASSTPANTAVSATSRPLHTSTAACGPYLGWIRSYVVQPGDTLFRIATMHGISVEILQRANCKTRTVIYSGERLWVPFVLPPPTELTVIPTFDTPTNEVTPPSSPTPTLTVAP